MRNKFTKALLAGAACVPLLTAATCSNQQVTDVNALLNGGPAATMIAYLTGLDPSVSGVLTNLDAAIAANAPRVLAIACGGGSAANFVFQTAAVLAPTVVTPSMATTERLAFGILSANCPPNPPPTNLAQAARAAWSAYEQILAGTQGAGVIVPPAQAVAARRR